MSGGGERRQRDRSGRYLIRRLLSRWVLRATAVLIVLAVIDAALREHSIIVTSFVVPVLALALVESGERTAAVAVLAEALALLSWSWHPNLSAATELYRLAVVGGGGALATLGAMLRARAVVARDQMEMLARVGEIADGTIALEDALRRLADVLVPTAADLCELWMLDSGSPRAVASRRQGAPQLDDQPGEPPSERALALARLGEILFVTPTGSGRSAAEADELRRHPGMGQLVFAPVRAASETFALLVLGVGPSGRHFRPDDLRFARTVGSRAGLAIRNAQLLAGLRDAQQRLEAVVGSLADAVTIRGLDGRVVYLNDAARHMLGMGPGEGADGVDPAVLFERFQLTDEGGRKIAPADLPSARLLRGEEPEPLTLRFTDRDGGERWRTLKSTPLFDAGGRLEAAVTIFEDVTATKRAELRSRFLSRASEVLLSSLDYEETLRNVAWLAVPEIADWCAVDLVDERGRRNSVAAAHRDPRKIELAQRLREMAPPGLPSDRGVGRVIATGEPLLYPEIPAELLERSATSPEHLALIRRLQMRSALIVPIAGAHGVLGAMTLVGAESGRVFTKEDLDFAIDLARRSGVAVENARLYSERSHIATTLQHSLLPEAMPRIEGWEVASLYRPASSGGAVEVGGDFYDAFPVADGWLMLVGDVTGKGVEAAAMTALVRHGARFVAEHTPRPAEVLTRLDRSLRQQPALSLCTAVCLYIQADRVHIACAGHPLPLLVTDDGVRAVGRAGPVLGAFADCQWDEHELRLNAAEVLLLYTDGVTDTVGPEERFGETRLIGAMAQCGPQAPADVLACLDAQLSGFQVGAQVDDTAIVALRRVGTPAWAAPAVAPGSGLET